ncbi:Cu(I)-responsive transcriptional regulator [Veronia nyctiphanis]|uniref:HTH-type transcriptional regulator CueR n=1 Tax=Veronia nyctiphanis TaxID=1278244 RepID=A0A4V1LT41_9GAMM|nr:Cu(I)-responsive transcriptional regulator [Veronia nyctiphanis]RXJ73878.1 Cu(I)-responsive transcriptional regulator [Veronia nyctiphanis]
MKINEVAQLTGLPSKTIRFYEQKAILSAPDRSENGYRAYNQQHINELLMIKRSRMVGFSLEECRELIALSRDPNRKSADVKSKAKEKLSAIDEKIEELKAMQKSLKALVDICPGDDSSCCPIIDALTESGKAEK